MLITRPKSQAGEFIRILEGEGIAVIPFPTIEIAPPTDPRPLEEALADLRRYHWVVFTSANGVRAFFQGLEARGGPKVLRGLKVAAIGPGTAKALEERGVEADLVPSSYYSEELARALLERGVKGKRILLPRAEGARKVLVEMLKEGGAEVDEVPAYRTVLPRGVQRLKEILPLVDLVAFTSGQAVRNFMEGLSAPWPTGLHTAAIGPITAKVIEGYGIEVHVIPEVYTLAGLAQAVTKFFKEGGPCVNRRPIS